jgi:hypothetical protein
MGCYGRRRDVSDWPVADELVVRRMSAFGAKAQGLVQKPSLLPYLGVGSRNFLGSGNYREAFNDQ